MPKRKHHRVDDEESEAAAEEEAAAAEAEAAPAEGANMAASIAASIALAKKLQAAEETGMLERQAQDAADAKIAIAWHKIENPDFDEAALAEQYRLASPGKFREAGAAAEGAAAVEGAAPAGEGEAPAEEEEAPAAEEEAAEEDAAVRGE